MTWQDGLEGRCSDRNGEKSVSWSTICNSLLELTFFHTTDTNQARVTDNYSIRLSNKVVRADSSIGRVSKQCRLLVVLSRISQSRHSKAIQNHFQLQYERMPSTWSSDGASICFSDPWTCLPSSDKPITIQHKAKQSMAFDCRQWDSASPFPLQ